MSPAGPLGTPFENPPELVPPKATLLDLTGALLSDGCDSMRSSVGRTRRSLKSYLLQVTLFRESLWFSDNSVLDAGLELLIRIQNTYEYVRVCGLQVFVWMTFRSRQWVRTGNVLRTLHASKWTPRRGYLHRGVRRLPKLQSAKLQQCWPKSRMLRKG